MLDLSGDEMPAFVVKAPGDGTLPENERHKDSQAHARAERQDLKATMENLGDPGIGFLHWKECQIPQNCQCHHGDDEDQPAGPAEALLVFLRSLKPRLEQLVLRTIVAGQELLDEIGLFLAFAHRVQFGTGPLAVAFVVPNQSSAGIGPE